MPGTIERALSEIVRENARPLTGAAHHDAWARIVAAHPFFADHQAGITRTIPVVIKRRGAN